MVFEQISSYYDENLLKREYEIAKEKMAPYVVLEPGVYSMKFMGIDLKVNQSEPPKPIAITRWSVDDQMYSHIFSLNRGTAIYFYLQFLYKMAKQYPSKDFRKEDFTFQSFTQLENISSMISMFLGGMLFTVKIDKNQNDYTTIDIVLDHGV